MNVKDLIQLVSGTLVNQGVDLSAEVVGGGGADLMSDVLASVQPHAILLTGLCNPQVVRTAQMADVTAIVLVRGKTPPVETVELATLENIPLITTPFGMFETCGRLYQAGVPSLERTVADNECGCD
jgi:hypothetical protein